MKDHLGQEILLKDGEFQVMMEWEKPYMEACIEALAPTGDVLEIGFGCGYSATHIQKFSPRSHTIIEYHPVVAEKAREWAKDHPGVEIVEDTWQNALPRLKMFDQVFFDDYPLQSGASQKKIFKEKEKASWIVKQGEKLLTKIHKKFSFLQSLKYQNEDIDYFFKHLQEKKGYQKEHFLPFFYQLFVGDQITKEQYDLTVTRLLKERILEEADVVEFEAKQRQQAVTFKKRGDRLFDFLDPCLKNHLKVGGRFSCYLEDPSSRYEDSVFMEKIILNPCFDFTETWIEVSPPSHCKYFNHEKALVMLITKQKESVNN